MKDAPPPGRENLLPPISIDRSPRHSLTAWGVPSVGSQKEIVTERNPSHLSNNKGRKVFHEIADRGPVGFPPRHLSAHLDSKMAGGARAPRVTDVLTWAFTAPE
jgi:hypothetical protein